MYFVETSKIGYSMPVSHSCFNPHSMPLFWYVFLLPPQSSFPPILESLHSPTSLVLGTFITVVLMHADPDCEAILNLFSLLTPF